MTGRGRLTDFVHHCIVEDKSFDFALGVSFFIALLYHSIKRRELEWYDGEGVAEYRRS